MKQGWKIKKLGEVCDFQNGFAFKSKTYKESGLPILRITNIQNDEIDSKELVFFDKNDYKEDLYRFRVIKNDLLIAMSGATTGKLGINKSDTVFYLNQRVGKFIPKKQLYRDFLYYFLSTKVEESLRIAAGAAQPNLSTEQINNFEIPLPPLPEQHRIVSILGQCFTAIDKTKANAEQNLKNAKELFESYLQGVFENGNWKIIKLNEITDVKDGTHDSPKYIKEGIPFITQKNIKLHGLSFDDIKFITEIDHEKFYKRSNVSYGDILISMIGANRGMAALVDDKRIFSIKNVGLIKSSNNINMQYLLYYLKSTKAMQYVLFMSNGGAQEFVGLTALRSFPIPLPPLKVQQTIVHCLDALRAETQKLEAIYRKKIVSFEELKKSILQKAFAGELTEKMKEV
jgi:type I restriction enzyme S subunit